MAIFAYLLHSAAFLWCPAGERAIFRSRHGAKPSRGVWCSKKTFE